MMGTVDDILAKLELVNKLLALMPTVQEAALKERLLEAQEENQDLRARLGEALSLVRALREERKMLSGIPYSTPPYSDAMKEDEK